MKYKQIKNGNKCWLKIKAKDIENTSLESLLSDSDPVTKCDTNYIYVQGDPGTFFCEQFFSIKNEDYEEEIIDGDTCYIDDLEKYKKEKK